MGKKLTVLLCFFAGAICLISAGLYLNKQQAGITDEYVTEAVSKVKSPELLSEINMVAYVSLPASFADIDIIENLDDIEVTEDNVDDIMYDQLFKAAKRSENLDKDQRTIVADYTVAQGGTVKEVKNSVVIGYDRKSTFYDETVYKSLSGLGVGESIHLENVTFNGYEDATLDFMIDNIYDMPYPVTDKYVKSNTVYKNVYDMRAALLNDATGEAKALARAYTINSLIDTMMDQTTFIKLPESLIMKELEALQKEEPNATYEEAKHSLYKLFFLASVIEHYDVATKTDQEKRFAKLEAEETENMTEYEIERKKYLLFEEDVITCIYKNVMITTSEP